MKNRGFTLVELLAVIVILGILLTLATTNVFGVLNNSKKGISDYTRTQIEDAANLYATDNTDNDCTNTCTFRGKTKIITALGTYFPDMETKCDIPDDAVVEIVQTPVNPEDDFKGGEVTVEISDDIVCQK